MKKFETIGLEVGKKCGRICLTAFIFALLAGISSCTNEATEEAVPEETKSSLPWSEETEQSIKREMTEITAPNIPENELRTVESAEVGSIMLSGGEIVSPSYLLGCSKRGLEPIGLVCFRIQGKKILVGMDAFYNLQDSYGWGNSQSPEINLSEVKSTFLIPGNNGSSFSLKQTGTKQYSNGNNTILLKTIKRGQEQNNVYLDYIASYGVTHTCTFPNLIWEAPSLYESFIIYCNKAKLLEGIKAVKQYFKNVNDSREKLLETSGAFVPHQNYILTSSAGEGRKNNIERFGIWAFKEIDREGGSPLDTKYLELEDENKKISRSFQYTVQDISVNKIYRIEYVLAKANSDGFATMAVAHLN